MIKGASAQTLPLSLPTPPVMWSSLQVSGPDSSSGSLDLRVAAEPVFPLPLFVGNRNTNQNFNLYINPPLTAGLAGYTLVGSVGTLSVSGVANSGHVQSFNVFISGPTGVIPNGSANLVVEGKDPKIESSGLMAMSIIADRQAIIPLALPASSGINSNVPLYIERDFANSLNLSIKHMTASGTPELAISGAYFDNNNMNLVVIAQHDSEINLITNGYLE